MKPDEMHFAIYFNKKGEPIKVEGPDGKEVEGTLLENCPVSDINKLESVLIGHKKGHSPCCVILLGKKYCWC